MSNPQSEYIKRWRYNTKHRVVEAFGGKCGICGYNKCQNSLAFHHLDPKEKEFSLSRIMANPISWNKIVIEMRKCVCVCHNCHNEIHEGMTTLPDDIKRFNEDYAEYKIEKREVLTPCIVCQTPKPEHQVTCSKTCAATLAGKVDWNKVNLEVEIKTKSMVQIGIELGCSDHTVRKRLVKLGLYTRKQKQRKKPKFTLKNRNIPR
jgi:hypothetical protein